MLVEYCEYLSPLKSAFKIVKMAQFLFFFTTVNIFKGMISDLVERREVKQKRLQVESSKQQLTSLPPRKI